MVSEAAHSRVAQIALGQSNESLSFYIISESFVTSAKPLIMLTSSKLLCPHREGTSSVSPFYCLTAQVKLGKLTKINLIFF